MIQVLILEDEEPAAKRLKKLLLEATEETEVLAVLESIKAAKEWFANNKYMITMKSIEKLITEQPN